MNIKRLLPYSIPLWISILFVLTANTPFIWIAVALMYFIAFFRKRIGKFQTEKILDEYLFFHYSDENSILKTLSGLFYATFNFWILYFLTNIMLETWHIILFIYSCIIINSNFAISLAHDLMHSEKKIDRFSSSIILLQNGFFYLESDHLYTHHRFVGTVNDPATAMKGENIYKYLFRSIKERIKITLFLTDHYPLKIRHKIILTNYLKLIFCVLYLLLALYLGPNLFIFLVLDYLFVTLIYESITYIQHYGLTRNALNNIKYESVQIQHSWNCLYKTSSYMHYMMPIHSQHHLVNDKEERNDFCAGNEMPQPFSTMMITAWIPHKWFKLMGK